uniref:kunitz-type trypsin inhibitor-like 1 protein n=1 Tax=Erigeron canadensis TaxID=72917 RepID=UPI001CB96BC7|nr:kunitz-type trypsin inhibitor-like 1 protein [Erigeron canadensis]
MKPSTFFLALTLIYLFTTPSLSSRSIVDDTVVYDREGNQLQKDAFYFISPPIRGPLGDSVKLTRPFGGNETCNEAYVIQPFFTPYPATPFSFTPVDSDVIKLGSPLAIQSTDSPCEGSTVWKVSSLTGPIISGNIITTGGIINTPSSCLRITKPEVPRFGGYIFEYCPYLCGPGFRICQPLGNNMGLLSPNAETPFEFVLNKASESAAAI